MNILENIKEKPIIAFLLILVCYYLYRDSYNFKKIEAMSDSNNNSLSKIIDKVYQVKLDPIRELEKTVTKLEKGNFKISKNLLVEGKLTVENNLDVENELIIKEKFNYLPKGTILYFRGTEIPSGWVLCNGENNTPDLRGRFILGAGQGADLTNRILNAKGGLEKVSLTVNQIPSHNHGFTYQFKDSWSGDPQNQKDWVPDKSCRKDWVRYKDHHSNTGNSGNGQPHENMPPFYVLSYIMKL